MPNSRPISEDTWIFQNFSESARNIIKGTTSQFAHLWKFSLKFSSSSFVIHVSLLHPKPSFFLRGLLLSLCCFPILVNYYYQVSFYLKVFLYVAKITLKYCDWALLNELPVTYWTFSKMCMTFMRHPGHSGNSHNPVSVILFLGKHCRSISKALHFVLFADLPLYTLYQRIRRFSSWCHCNPF